MPPAPAPNRERVDRFAWNRDYFRGRTSLARARWWACVLMFGASLAWVAVSLLSSRETANQQFTHGPVSNPHASWDNRCDACHVPHSAREFSLTGLFSAHDVHQRWNEFRCETCHQGPAGQPRNFAPHHADAVPELSCAACHHDHQGRDFSLVRVADTDCTQCHQDLKDHHKKQTPQFAQRIGRFESGHADSHPEFKGRPKDFRRALRFNHAHHMMEGIPLTTAAVQNDTNGVMSIAAIPAEFRDRYRQPGQTDQSNVQLSCSSCHQLDAGRLTTTELQDDPEQKRAWQADEALLRGLPVDSILPPCAAGAYYLPVNFELHCQACHPIKTGAISAPGTNVTIPSLTLPHRLTTDQIDKQLRLAVIDELTRSKKAEAPSKTTAGDRLDPIVDEPLISAVNEFSKRAKERLFLAGPRGEFGQGCLKCHDEKTGAPMTLEPTNSPTVWYPHAKFDHTKHRAMTCASCHPGKHEPIAGSSGQVSLERLRTPEPIDIPNIQNCQQCHVPAKRNGQPIGGARHDCVECHRYHNGAAPLQGPGSPLRDPPDPLRLDRDEFLRGRPKKD